MRPTLDPAGHRVPRTKPTCLLHTWRPHRQRPFTLVLHLHQHESSCNLHLQYLAKNQSTQRCQSLITQGSDHPPVLEPDMVLTYKAQFVGFAKAPEMATIWETWAHPKCKFFAWLILQPRVWTSDRLARREWDHQPLMPAGQHDDGDNNSSHL
jgi:hypothetical protein